MIVYALYNQEVGGYFAGFFTLNDKRHPIFVPIYSDAVRFYTTKRKAQSAARRVSVLTDTKHQEIIVMQFGGDADGVSHTR